jgi:hypothetical protein
MFRSFFTTIFRGSFAVLCAVTIPPADLRSLSIITQFVAACVSSVCVWCSCLLVICLLQISGRDSNGTKHGRGLPEDGREKRPKHVGVLYLQKLF